MRRLLLVLTLAAVLVVGVSACSSSDDAAAVTSTKATAKASTTTATPVATVPVVEPGIVDCGTSNELAGWPTTTVATPQQFSCITDALAARTPAQMSVISVGNGESGRQTQDGYDIPTRRIVTWRVLAKGSVEQITDETEDGGEVVTVTCTGLSAAGFQSPPSGNGCT